MNMESGILYRCKELYWKTKNNFMKMRRDYFGLTNFQNLFIDVKYGGACWRILPSKHKNKGAYRTQSTSYYKLKKLFEQVDIKEDDVLVDVGCGQGRVINFWLDCKLKNRIIGIELDEDIALKTRERLLRYKNVFIVGGDASEHCPADGTLFYLYNPFNGDVLVNFLNKVLNLCTSKERIRIVYNVPRHINIVLADPRWKIKNLKMGIQEPACLIIPCLSDL
jgi:hypothetical protein